jgi:hypothetical protein
MVDNIITVLKRRDGLTTEEAVEMVREAYVEWGCGNDPHQIEEMLHHDIGLEPDFIEDVIALADKYGW